MEIIIQILQEYDGIIGAILGVIATLITTDWLNRKGKLNIYVMNWKDKYETYEDVGCFKGGKERTDFYGYESEVILEVYNGSNTQKIMRNVKTNFYKDDVEKYKATPKNEDSRRKTESGWITRDSVEVVNFKPKEVIKLKLSNYIYEDKLNEIEKCNKVYLTYIDEKNKTRKILLYNGLITQKNYKKEVL